MGSDNDSLGSSGAGTPRFGSEFPEALISWSERMQIPTGISFKSDAEHELVRGVGSSQYVTADMDTPVPWLFEPRTREILGL